MYYYYYIIRYNNMFAVRIVQSERILGSGRLRAGKFAFAQVKYVLT